MREEIMVASPQPQSIEFEFYHHEALEVFLIVDPDSPMSRQSRMTHDPSGRWRCRVDLLEGAHGFCFLADGISFSGVSINLPSPPRTIFLGCNTVRIANGLTDVDA
jgi:hypothetical protein